jgi:hypothetical protein
MDTVLNQGVELILWIQAQRNPAADAFFRAITHLGGMAHLYIVPALVWCLGYRRGSRLLLTLLVSVGINFGLKDLFAQPRPFELDPRIGPDREFGYGIPSGHAQHTAIEWGAVAAWVARPWFSLFALVLIALIGFSRVYLGVHFPTDVLAGWAIAGVMLWLHLRHGEALARRIGALGAETQVLLACAGSAAFVLAYLVLPKTPYQVGTGGLFLGATLGMLLCARYLRAPEDGAIWQRLLRYPFGMAPLLAWAAVAGRWVPQTHDFAYFVVIYLNCAVAGLWITAGAPALFQLSRLSPR